MKKLLILPVAVMFFSCSSGPTPEEIKEKDKKFHDSMDLLIKEEAEKMATQKLADDSAKKAYEEDSLQKYDAKQQYLDDLNRMLIDKKADLEAAKQSLADAKPWKMGRTPAEKEAEIKRKTKKVLELEKEIEDLEQTIQNTASTPIRY